MVREKGEYSLKFLVGSVQVTKWHWKNCGIRTHVAKCLEKQSILCFQAERMIFKLGIFLFCLDTFKMTKGHT